MFSRANKENFIFVILSNFVGNLQLYYIITYYNIPDGRDIRYGYCCLYFHTRVRCIRFGGVSTVVWDQRNEYRCRPVCSVSDTDTCNFPAC